MIFAISLLAGGSILLIVAALFNYYKGGSDVVRDRVLDMGKANVSPEEQYLQQEFSGSLAERLLGPAAKKFADIAAKFAPTSLYHAAAERVEDAGGYPGGVTGFLITIVISATISILLTAWYIIAKSPRFSTMIVVAIFGVVIGFGLPFAYINDRISDRREAMRRAMPDVLDLLCVSVQAGLGFDAALGRVTAKMQGPLLDEMRRLLQELRMGVTRRSALLRLAKRCGIEEMKLFAAAIIQAEKLGVGMAQVLEIQSANMRELRRQRAHEAAAKLPVKILLPTVAFIFPVLFIVVLGPPLITIMNNLFKK